MGKKVLISESYEKSLFKCLLFISTITVELLVGFTESKTDYSAFYLTVFVQAVNNIYDASTYINHQEYTCNIVEWATAIICGAVLSGGMAICYLASASNSKLHIYLSTPKPFMLIAVAGVACIIIPLVADCVSYLRIMKPAKENNKSSENLSNTLEPYIHIDSDELDEFLNKK